LFSLPPSSLSVSLRIELRPSMRKASYLNGLTLSDSGKPSKRSSVKA